MALYEVLKEKIQPFLEKPARFLYGIGLTPNKLTLISLMFGLMAFYYFLRKELLIGGIFGLLNFITDTFDGAVARAMKKETALGKFFDLTSDFAIRYVLWFFALAYSGFISYQIAYLLIATTFFFVFFSIVKYLNLKSIFWLPHNFITFILLGIFLNQVEIFAQVIIVLNIIFFLINLIVIFWLNLKG